MSLPQHITKGIGGAVYVDLQTRPTTVTVDAYTGSGAQIVSSQSGTVSTINSTLASAATRGATSLSITAMTGIAAGSVLHLSDDAEQVLVYKVTAGTPGTAHLRRPLLRDHASGAAVIGTRCTYTIDATGAAARFFDGRVKWTLNSGAVVFSELECTDYPWTRHANQQDFWDINPQLFEVLDVTVDLERLLERGHEDVLQRIGAHGRARVFTGSSAFRRATVLAASMLFYEPQPTDEGTRLFERYTALLGQELERVVETTPRDENQNGVIEERERITTRSAPIRR